MSAHPFGRERSARAQLARMIGFVEGRLRSLPVRRRRGIDFYYGGALERVRMQAASAGANIGRDASRTVFSFGGIEAEGVALDDAMRAWIDAAARAVVEGSEVVGKSADLTAASGVRVTTDFGAIESTERQTTIRRAR